MLCSSVSYAKAEDVGREEAGTVQMHVQMCVCFLTSASPFELTVEWEQRESHRLRYETISPSSPRSPLLRRAQAHLENFLTSGKCSFYLGFRVGLVVIERRTWIGKKILLPKKEMCQETTSHPWLRLYTLSLALLNKDASLSLLITRWDCSRVMNHGLTWWVELLFTKFHIFFHESSS